MCEADSKGITAYREDKDFFVRSSYSSKLDLIINRWYTDINTPAEAAYLVPKETAVTDFSQGEYRTKHYRNGIMLYRFGDDFPAYQFGREYGYLGGNHGSPFGRIVAVPKHSLTNADLGAELTDETGAAYYILDLPDADHIVFHPEGRKSGRSGFAEFSKGQKLFLHGKELSYTEVAMQQILPSNRVKEDILRIDGKTPLPDRTPVKCSYLQHVFEYEIVMPEARVELFKTQPGIRHDFIDPKLPALLRIRYESQYQPFGACVTQITNTVLHNFKEYSCLGVMMGICNKSNIDTSGILTGQDQTELYIPKLKSIKASVINSRETVNFDFSAVADFAPMTKKAEYMITSADCIDPQDPADRFILLSGNRGEHKYGVALGYSLIDGMTAKENKGKDRPNVYHLYYSRKMYPCCCYFKNPSPGHVRHITAYRQYFNPRREPDATSFYWNRQGGADIVYLDFHKKLDRKTIKLPSYMMGKKISVVEQTPSVRLHTQKVVPQSGISLSLTNGYGYIVLELS